MPTKRQLSRIRESQLEYPELRRQDDTMFNNRVFVGRKEEKKQGPCQHWNTYVDDDFFIKCVNCDEIIDC